MHRVASGQLFAAYVAYDAELNVEDAPVLLQSFRPRHTLHARILRPRWRLTARDARGLGGDVLLETAEERCRLIVRSDYGIF